jgi:glycosyltransferase involved in cell wall biosynthesis
VLRFEPPARRGGARRFHLALDATAVVPGRKGLGRFQERLLSELDVAGLADLQGTILVAPGFEQTPAQPPAGWQVEVVEGRLGSARELLGVPRVLRRLAPDVYLSMADRLRAPRGVPVVLYLFEDPVYRIRANTLDDAVSSRQHLADVLVRVTSSLTLRRADHVVAASTSTARDLALRRGVDPRKISVAMPGPFARVARWSGASDDEPRVLAFIDRDPRDNGASVLQAFATTPRPWRLDVIGDADPRVVALAERMELTDRVRFHGRVDQPTLEASFPAAQIYLDVSLYEGYGFQAAEAVACGVPSVVSAVTSLPEVTQHRASYVNPHKPDEIAAALNSMIDSADVRQAAAGAFAREEIEGRWPALVRHVLDVCRALVR